MVDSGVLQGSVLGPILFLIYVDDAARALDCEVAMFVDDMKIWNVIRGPADEDRLQMNLNLLEEWANRWLLRFNVGKCSMLHLGNAARSANTRGYFLGGAALQEVEAQKDLGVLTTSSLKPSAPCSRSALDEQPVPSSPRRPVLSDESTLPENISFEVKEAARKLVDFFEERYSEKVGSLLDDALHVGTASEPSSSISASGATTPSDETLSPSSRPSSPEMMLSLARLHYRTVLHELFAQQINWGRIIAMFSFLRALCQTLESSPPDATTPSSAASTTGPFQTPPRWTTETTRAMYDAPIPSTDATYSVDQTDACYLSPLTNEGPRPEDKLPPLRCGNDAGDRAIVGRLDRRAVHYIIWTTEYIHEDRNLWNWIVNHNNWEGLVAFEAGADDNLQSQFLRALVSIGGVILGTLGIAAALRFVTRRL
nr:unnamed protein product [Spirometra erinaceieuropaei]